MSIKEMDWFIDQTELYCKLQTSKEGTGHDFWHHIRVKKICEKIQAKEGGNLLVLRVAALLHDVFRYREKTHGELHFGDTALSEIKTFLINMKFPTVEMSEVLDCVRHHEDYSFDKKNEHSIEIQILQDADRLDALGAIGIGRTFLFSGSHELLLWNPDEKSKLFDPTIKPNNSGITHFYDKLLRLEKMMNTNTAKIISKRRTHFMRIFLDKFFEEWELKDVE